MNIKELAATIVTCSAAASLIYGAGVKTGLVIGRAEAEEIAQQKANVVAHQLYLDRLDNEERQLQSDIDVLMLQINFMLSKPNRTEYDTLQLKIWQDVISSKQKRIADIKLERKQKESSGG